MKFPNLVYKSPGTHQAPGGTFDYLSVKSDAELEAAAKAGYYPTPELAIQKPDPEECWSSWLIPTEAPAPEPKPAGPSGNNSVRAELELKAGLLGIEFNDKTRDSTLMKKIAEAEAE